MTGSVLTLEALCSGLADPGWRTGGQLTPRRLFAKLAGSMCRAGASEAVPRGIAHPPIQTRIILSETKKMTSVQLPD